MSIIKLLGIGIFLYGFSYISPLYAGSTFHSPDPLNAIRSNFANPPRKYSPVPIWWWSGDKIRDDRLAWQMRKMVEGHIYNAVILNLNPSTDDPAYFTPEWWDRIRFTVGQARDLGMSLWIYDHLGFSSSNIASKLTQANPDFRGQSLERIEATVSEGEIAKLSVPPGAPFIAASASRFASDSSFGQTLNLTDLAKSGALSWTAPKGRWKVSLFFTNYGYYDFANPQAAAKLLDTVLGEYERQIPEALGKEIVGVFQDELVAMPGWSKNYLEEFKKRKGYDLSDHLIALFEDCGPDSAKYRYDYRDLLASMLEDSFYKPYYQWCQKHHMQNSHDNQMREAEPIDAQRTYVDYFRTGRWYSAPGHEQTSDTRVQVSISHLYERERVWQEGFWGAGWGQTLEELKDQIDKFYAHGSNLYNPHAWYYSTHGSWWEWAPPCTSFRQPYWMHYKYLADYVSRMSYLLSTGSHVCDIAVLYPEASLQDDLTIDGHASPVAESIKTQWKTIVKSLDADERDYDWIDEDSLLRANCKGGRIKVSQEEYRVLVLPTMTIIRKATAQRIAEFCKSGGTAIKIGEGPMGSTEKGLNDPDIVQLFTGMKNLPSMVTVNDSKSLIDQLVQTLERDCSANVQSLHRRIAGKEFYFVLPSKNTPQDMQFRSKGKPELWDPYTGNTLPVLNYSITNAGTKITMDFNSSPAYFIVIDPARQTPSEHKETKPQTRLVSIPLSDKWDFEIAPTMDNRWGDFAFPASTKPLPVESRQFRYAEEPSDGKGISEWKKPDFDDSKWNKTLYTFAPYWEMTGPYQGSGPVVFDAELPPESSDPQTEWRPVVYSRLLGIDKDPANGRGTHGPKSIVYPEFVCLGANPDWTTFYLRTFLFSPIDNAAIVVGYPFAKKLWINDRLVLNQSPESGAVSTAKGALNKGWNKVLLKVIQSKPGNQEDMRVSFFVADKTHPTPKWIWQSNAGADTAYFRKEISLPSDPLTAQISITADNGFELYTNGKLIGKKIGIDTASWQNAERYSLPLHMGMNVIAVKGINLGGIAGLVAKGRIETANRESIDLLTDESWMVSSEDTPAWNQALPQGTWSNATVVADYANSAWGPVNGMDFDSSAGKSETPRMPIFDMPGVIYDTNPTNAAATWYRFSIPPGTQIIHLAMTVPCDLYLNGEQQTFDSPSGIVKLKQLALRGGVCAIRAATKPGMRAGAAFTAPVQFDCGPGKITLGSWHEKGLPHYSGMGIYKQSFVLPAEYKGQPVSLNLGKVRGTVEVLVNNRSAGIRLWSPFVFDLTSVIKPGENRLEIKVTNTLGPHYLVGQPAHYVFNGQQISGLTDPPSLQVALPFAE